MKRLCFGALLKIIYQARINGVTKPKLCTAVAIGFNSLYEFDSTGASHQMNCHDNPPLSFMDAVTTCDINEASRLFTVHVISLLKNSLCKDIVKAIQVILEDDNTIPEDTIIGKISGYEKKNIIISTNFNLADLLCNAFYYVLPVLRIGIARLKPKPSVRISFKASTRLLTVFNYVCRRKLILILLFFRHYLLIHSLRLFSTTKAL